MVCPLRDVILELLEVGKLLSKIQSVPDLLTSSVLGEHF